MSERILLVFATAILAGWLSWQLALPQHTLSKSQRESGVTPPETSNSWVRENPGVFGAGVGIIAYVAGTLTLVALDRRDKNER
jgi:hypothetical protein